MSAKPEGPAPEAPTRSSSMLERLVRAQVTAPLRVLLVALLTVLIAGFGASRLKLKTSFGELLPKNKESVLIANRVAERLNTAATLTVVAQGSDNEALKRFVDELGPELRALGPDWIAVVDDGVRESRAFFAKNALLYGNAAEVQRIHDRIRERYEYEVAKQTGLLLDDSDPPPPITKEVINEEATKHTAKAEEQYPDGYYLDPNAHMIVVLCRTPVSGGDLERSRELQRRIEEVIARINPQRLDPTIKVNFSGNLLTSAEEYAQVKDDLSDVGVLGVAMILAAVFLFYLRLRVLVAMALSITVGVVWTFGLAYLAIGHLNSSTGFLVSIVVGNGINFAIIYMARYLEARRFVGADESVLLAHRETWLGTLGAAGAAMVAYGSLIVTDLRGFNHFGLIGGAGMILCWLATYLFLPSILVLFERVSPIESIGGLADRLRGMYGHPFAHVAMRWPRAVLVIALGTGVAALALAYRYIADDPMEYNMSNTRNEPTLIESPARQLSRPVDKIVGRQGQDGLAIMVDRVDQVLPLKAALEARRDAAPEGQKPFQSVVSIFNLLPSDQERKIELGRETREILEKARRRGFIKDADWVEIERYLPADGLRPIGIADLPEQAARSFTEKDGTRGRLVYIVPTEGRSVWDAHYLILWADSFRSTPLPDGSVVKGSGSSVIFADLILSVIEDTPKAIAISLGSTLLIVLLAFRNRRAALLVTATLVLGLAWMLAVLALWHSKLGPPGPSGLPQVEIEGMKLNFLNFVALPITIGVGADYAVNVMQRYRFTGSAGLRRVIVETGGAVILCSLTTTLGYLALTRSVNKAIQSFGVAAAAGEICCLIAAVLVLPAWLQWRRRPRRDAASITEPAAEPAAIAEHTAAPPS